MSHFVRAIAVSIGLSVVLFARGAGAAPFVNLDFEQATVVPTGVNTVSATAAFPGWAARTNGSSPLPDVRYNRLGGPGIALWDIDNSPGFTVPLLQGKYMAVLESVEDLGVTFINSLTQAGEVPAGTRSIRLLGVTSPWGPARVTLDGQTIPLISLGEIAPRVSLYAGDVEAFAGLSVDLGLHGPAPFWPVAVDEVHFSAEPIPEATSAAALFAGVGLTQWRRRHSRTKTQHSLHTSQPI